MECRAAITTLRFGDNPVSDALHCWAVNGHHQHRHEQISSFVIVLSMALVRLIEGVSVYLRHRVTFVLANHQAH